MNITQRLRLTSAAQSRTATIYANTGNTNNYVAFAESYPDTLYYIDPWGSYTFATSYANYNTTGNPASSGGSVTGYATDSNYQVLYTGSFNTIATAAFDWVITFPSPTQFTITFSNVAIEGTFSWKMEVTTLAGGSTVTTSGSGVAISNGAHTVNVGQTHSNGINIYHAILTIENVTYGSVVINPNIYVDSYDTLPSYYWPLYPDATKSGSFSSPKYSYKFQESKLLFRFDTSSLGASAVIMSASLNIYTSSVANLNNPNVGVYISPAWPVTTYNSTWYNTGNTLVTAKALTTITNGGNTSFTIDPAYINKTGNTECRIQLSKPGEPNIPDTNFSNSFNINLNGTTRPYLTILYR